MRPARSGGGRGAASLPSSPAEVCGAGTRQLQAVRRVRHVTLLRAVQRLQESRRAHVRKRQLHMAVVRMQAAWRGHAARRAMASQKVALNTVTGRERISHQVPCARSKSAFSLQSLKNAASSASAAPLQLLGIPLGPYITHVCVVLA